MPKHTATELPGKWFVVVMEKVHALRIRDAGRVHVHRELQNVLEELKSNDFVHGDLRPQNILPLADNSIRVVDFDWAGKSGVVTEGLFMQCSGSRPSNYSPPFRTHVKELYTPCYLCDEVVQEGSLCLNHPELVLQRHPTPRV